MYGYILQYVFINLPSEKRVHEEGCGVPNAIKTLMVMTSKEIYS
jgi:hypothetical protein